MSLLAYNELVEICENGVLTKVDYDLINSASIDIRLGEFVLVEHCVLNRDDRTRSNAETLKDISSLYTVSLKNKDQMRTRQFSLVRDGPYHLYPGEFILAQSFEMFHLPNNLSAEYKLKSSMARIGLEHLNAGWCDAGWHGSVLTLELKNVTRDHVIILEYLDKIGQMCFFKHEEVPADKSYATRGRYNKNRTVSGVRRDPRMELTLDENNEPVIETSLIETDINIIPFTSTHAEDSGYDDANTDLPK